MPRCATALNFVIPPAPACRGTEADSNFLPHRTAQRHQAGQEIRGSVREGPAVSLGPHANAERLLCPQRLHGIDGCGAPGRDQRGGESAHGKQATHKQNRRWIMFADTKEEGLESPRRDP
jgi:hypothetical protein